MALDCAVDMALPPGFPGPREGNHDPRIGAVLADRYRIDALIDSGAMGRVYVGEHVLMRKRVAIKVLHRELTLVPEFVARFEREAMAAANIQSEHVVAATDFGKLPDGSVFLVLEYLEGRNLRDEITGGPIPLIRALDIARQIAVALKSAHALSIVHRDLKPDNVMLVAKEGEPDFVKVLDFGIAKVPIGEITNEAEKPITKSGMVFGTPEYMPPEQALGQSVDARADLYSLGVILFEMLAGVRPFAGASNVGILGQQLSRDAPSVSERAPGVNVPPPIQRFVARLLSREASERIQTAQAAVEEIEKYLGLSPARQRIPTLGAGTHPTSLEALPASSLAGFAPGTRARASRALGRIGDWVDSRKHLLPGPLRKVPAPVLLSVPMAVLGLVVGIGLVNTLGSSGAPAGGPSPGASQTAPSSGAAAPERVEVASDRDLAAATAEGLPALATLAARFPKDARIPLARSGVLLREKDMEGAVRALAQVLELDPAQKDDAQIASALWVTAQNKKSSAAALTLLTGPMGERGRAILYDLATTAGVKPTTRDAATKALANLGVPGGEP